MVASISARPVRAAVRVALCLSTFAVASFPLRAVAQSEVPLAEALYQAARELMAQGDYATACPKFAESYRLDPATGTLLNLAACHEGEGKLASAWAEYMDVTRIGRRDGRADRVKYAREHADALLPKLSRLTISTAPGVDPAGLEITLDGTPVGQVTLGVAAPLDPGSHVVVARAAGKKPFSQTVVLGNVADQQVVTIPALLPDETALPRPLEPVAVATVAPPKPAPDVSQRASGSGGLTTPVIVTGSLTLALTAATVATGIVYLEHRSSYRAATDPVERQSEYDKAQGFGIASTALFAGTLGCAAVTAYLYATSPRSTPRARFSPVLAPGLAFVTAGGEF